MYESAEQISLSEEQLEKFKSFEDIVRPLIVQLAEANNSDFADQILEETKRFKDSLKAEDINISDEQVDAFVQSLFDFKEELAA